MKVGIPREVKIRENRVACTPQGAHTLTLDGHEVRIETAAGEGCGFTDTQYVEAGATLVPSAADAWSADLVLKVKEPTPDEYPHLRPGLLLFTFLHLAADAPLTTALLETRTTGIAYETVQLDGRLPLLEPMSEVAGRMSVLVGANVLSKAQGGKGILLAGVPGILPGKVLVIGGGTAGLNAARIAHGMGAEVTITDVNIERLRELDTVLGHTIRTLYSTRHNIVEQLPGTDLLIAAALVPGARAPKLVTRDMLRLMEPGSALVDIAIDQGGCVETSRPTTHDNPVFVTEGVLHYCVANMPGAFPRTSTLALTNATLPYAVKIAKLGLEGALRSAPELRSGINTLDGRLTCRPVAEAHGMAFTALEGASGQ